MRCSLASVKAFVLIVGTWQLLNCSAALSDTISIPFGGGSATIGFALPIGQTFTATQPKYSQIGLGIKDVNPASSSNFGIDYKLYAGEGVFGLPLKSETAVVPSSGFENYLYMFAGDINFVVGNQYSLVVTNNTTRWGVMIPPFGFSYEGGGGLDSGFYSSFDYSFSAIPEPSCIALSLLGLCAGILSQRRNRNA